MSNPTRLMDMPRQASDWIRGIIMAETKDYWSECGQVYFLDGWGWGLTEKCQRICLGKEADILECFKTGKLPANLHPAQREALSFVLQYRKEQGYGERGIETKRTGDFRSRPTRAIKRRTANTRQAKTRKRLAIYPA